MIVHLTESDYGGPKYLNNPDHARIACAALGDFHAIACVEHPGTDPHTGTPGGGGRCTAATRCSSFIPSLRRVTEWSLSSADGSLTRLPRRGSWGMVPHHCMSLSRDRAWWLHSVQCM